jgi:Tol biopolymer transport system component
MPSRNRRRAVLAALLLVVMAAATIVAAPARAGWDDGNGQIAFRRSLDVQRSTGAIFLINPDGSGDRQLTQPLPGGHDETPNWSPRGDRILFSREPRDDPDGHRAFWTIKPDGTHLQLVSPGCLDGPTPARCLPNEQKSQPVYSPDGKQIAYGWAGGNVRDDIGQIEFSELYVMNADGSHPHPLTSFTKREPYSSDAGNPAWSPDGREIVFERALSFANEPAGGHALFIISARGGRARQLTPWALRGGGRPDWSSDGRSIVFRTIPENDEPGGDIYTIRPNGSGLRRLTRFTAGSVLGELGFSPDGGSIVFTKGSAATRDLFVMGSDGSRIQQITQTELSENVPDWGPGGRR